MIGMIGMIPKHSGKHRAWTCPFEEAKDWDAFKDSLKSEDFALIL